MSFANVILSRDPAMYFRLNETSGLDAADYVGNPLAGTIGAGVTLGVDGLVSWDADKAMYFHGSANSRIDLSSAPTPQLDMTAMAIIQPMDDTSTNRAILSIQNGTKTLSFRQFGSGLIVAHHDGSTLRRRSTNQGEWAVGDTVFVAAAISGGGTISIYVNAVERGAGTPGTLQANGNVIGNNAGGNTPFDGAIDEVAVFNRALSADEIAHIYNSLSLGSLSPFVINTTKSIGSSISSSISSCFDG